MNPASRFHTRFSPIYVRSGHPSSRLNQTGQDSAVNEDSQFMEYLPRIEEIPADTARAVKKDFRKLRARLRRLTKHVSFALIAIFTLIGMTFSGVFVAMQYHLLDVKGSSISRDSFFKTVPKTPVMAAAVSHNATAISCVQQLTDGSQVPVCAWNKSAEYGVIRDGLNKDKDVISEVSQETGVSPRMIAGVVVPEQLRWFTDDRESFKKLFEPLKVLGVAAHMTYGIGGFHPDTAKRVEQYAADSNSPFYAGDGMAALMAYPSVENPKDTDTLSRLSDYKDHYYSYLYVAMFIREITNQWTKAGYDIGNRPDVIATLYNIGFDKSEPKVNPQIGGADITVGGTRYTYGELGTDFYNSDELTSIFPMKY